MKIYLSGDLAYLWGDWTSKEISYCNIDFLTGLLNQIESEGRKHLRIDCAHLDSIDASGASFLDIWLHCLRIRGIEHEIINVSDKQQESFRDLGRHHRVSYQNPFERKFLTSNQRKRRNTHENRRNQANRQATSH